MIKIQRGRVTESEGRSTLSTVIDIDGEKKNLRLSVESEYGKYFSPERADYVLVGMLAYALRNKHDIICEAPVTDELLYNIRELLIPTFVRTDERNYPVKIQADIAPALDKVPVENATYGGVGTGISCGVDSFYTVTKYLNSEYPNRKLTHVCIFNNGSLANLPGRDSLTYKKKVFERAEDVAREINLPLLKLESNFPKVVPQSHFRTHTYMDALAIYALQKLWRVYYYSSSHSFWEFSLKDNMDTAPGYFEPFLLDCFSTSALKIIPSGSEVDRNDKIDFFSENPIAQKHLHVCLKKETNCGWCAKCLRTLLALDAMGKLDNFKESFDVDAYIKSRKKAYNYLYKELKKNPNNSFLVRSYEILYSRHKKLFDAMESN